METSPFKFPVIREPAGPGSGTPSTTTAGKFSFPGAGFATPGSAPFAVAPLYEARTQTLSTAAAAPFGFPGAGPSAMAHTDKLDIRSSATGSTTAQDPRVFNFKYRGAFGLLPDVELLVLDDVLDECSNFRDLPPYDVIRRTYSIQGIKVEIAKAAGVSPDQVTLFNEISKREIKTLKDLRYSIEPSYMISDPMSQPELEWGATRRSRGRRSKGPSKGRSKSRRSKSRSKSRRSKSRRSRR
jgi:hypothetical protein